MLRPLQKHIRGECRRAWLRGLRLLPPVLLMLAAAACGTARRVPAPPVRAADGGVRLEVAVTGFRSTRGRVRGALFATAAGFPMEHERALRRAEAPAREGAALVFEPVPPGEYALAVLHDEDADGRMARNVLGIPREGYALSGTPQVGLPRFADSLIRLDPPRCRMGLRLKYWGE